MATFRELAEEMCDLANIDPPRQFSSNRNTNQTGRQALRCFNLAVRTLVGAYMWEELKTEETVTLVADQTAYTLSEDPKRIHMATVYDDARNWPTVFPVDERVWLEARHGTYTNPDRYLIWPAGNQINVHPAPGASPGVLKLIMNGTKAVRDASGVRKSQFDRDDDRTLLNEMMVMLEARWRFLQLRQMPWQEAYGEAQAHTKRQMNRNGGQMTILFAGSGHRSGISDPYPEDTVHMFG